mgnify:CR=1 FL=1
MSDLWLVAGGDAEAERHRNYLVSARTAATQAVHFVLGSSGPDEYRDREALVADRLDAAVASAIGSDSGSFLDVRMALLSEMSKDFSAIHQAREQERTAELRRREERQASERAAAHRVAAARSINDAFTKLAAEERLAADFRRNVQAFSVTAADWRESSSSDSGGGTWTARINGFEVSVFDSGMGDCNWAVYNEGSMQKRRSGHAESRAAAQSAAEAAAMSVEASRKTAVSLDGWNVSTVGWDHEGSVKLNVFKFDPSVPEGPDQPRISHPLDGTTYPTRDEAMQAAYDAGVARPSTVGAKTAGNPIAVPQRLKSEPCDACGAKAGEPCKTNKGETYPDPEWTHAKGDAKIGPLNSARQAQDHPEDELINWGSTAENEDPEMIDWSAEKNKKPIKPLASQTTTDVAWSRTRVAVADRHVPTWTASLNDHELMVVAANQGFTWAVYSDSEQPLAQGRVAKLELAQTLAATAATS